MYVYIDRIWRWITYKGWYAIKPKQPTKSLNLFCHSKTDARYMQDGRKAVWSIPYVSVAFFSKFKTEFIAYRSSKVSSRPDCIFEIHQLWQSGFSRVYSSCCCSCSFEAEIIKIGQSSHKMYSNNILNCQVSMTILNACTKKVWKLIEGTTNILKSDITFVPTWYCGMYELCQCKCVILYIDYSWICMNNCIFIQLNTPFKQKTLKKYV